MIMKNASILIIDDNPSVGDALELLLRPKVRHLQVLNHPKSLNTLLRDQFFDVVLLDMNFAPGTINGNEGLFWLRQILEWAPDTAVLMITAYGEVELAVKALKAGAMDFILKPWKNAQLLGAITTALELRKSRFRQQEKKAPSVSHSLPNVEASFSLIGQSPAFIKVGTMVEKVAKTDANVLITGEHGTGKELIAQEIHRLSHRNLEGLVTVDMGAVQPQLFESELFGHIKGAFTDAREDRIGKFELAHTGTLFLDEIGNLPLALQQKLLVVLQRREIVRVGSNTPKSVDIRLICATNAQLTEQVKTGNFREDLLYRINTIRIHVPPLRERGQDIIILAEYFLQRFVEKYQRPGLSLHPTAHQQLLSYQWPGNVRELEHTIEKAVILSDSPQLKPTDFGMATDTFSPPTTQSTLAEMEKHVVLQAIRQHEGNLSAAAKQLGITRQTLYNKMKKYEI